MSPFCVKYSWPVESAPALSASASGVGMALALFLRPLFLVATGASCTIFASAGAAILLDLTTGACALEVGWLASDSPV